MAEKQRQQISYSYRQLAEITPHSARTWRWRVAQRKIRAVKDGNCLVILHEDLMAYYASLPEAKSGAREGEVVSKAATPAHA